MAKLNGEHLDPFDTPLGRSIVAGIKARERAPVPPAPYPFKPLPEQIAWCAGYTAGRDENV